MESTHISAANGNLAEYFVSYSGEENSELVMQTGSSSSEVCDQPGSIYISTPPDVRVEHVSVDKDGNLILQTSSSKTDGKACEQPKGIAPQVVQPFYTSLPSTSQALPSENTFITYKDGVVVEENKELLLAQNNSVNSDEKIFLLQPHAGENVNLVLANAVNNNADLTALRQANENIVLNIVTEDGQKLENVILTQNVGEPIGIKPKPSLDMFHLPDSLGRSSQPMLESYSKPVTSEKTRGSSGRRRSGRGRGRATYVPQPVLREFHMEKKLTMLSNFQELVKTSQSKIKPSTSKLSANCSRTDTVRAVNTDQNTIILTRSQPRQSLLQHPKTSKTISEALSSRSTEMPTSMSVVRPQKTPVPPKLVTTPVIMKTSDLKGVSHKGLQQLVSKGASVPQVSTRTNPTAKADSAKKTSSQMSTIVVVVPPPSPKWDTSAAEVDAKEKPLLENPSIMFSQNSSSSRTMLYEIPAKIVKFQEDKPLQRKLPFRHQDYLKVTKIQNEGEPIRPPGRFYKSRGSKKSVQISIPVVEKLADEKGTKIVNSAQQLQSMYPLLSTRLPQIAKVVDSSSINIPQTVLGTEAAKSEPATSHDHSSSAANIKSSLTPECLVSSHPKLDLQVTDMKTNIVSKDVRCIDKQLKDNTAAQTTDSAPSFCHSNVLRTYQELRSISQKGRSCSPVKMTTKNLKQNCQTCATPVSGIDTAEATNIEISQAVQVERQDKPHNMKSVTLESVLKHLKIASPDDSAAPVATSCTFKSDVAVEQQLFGTASHNESAESVLPDAYLNKQEAAATSNTQNANDNLVDSAQHKTDAIPDNTLKKDNDVQLLPHSQKEKDTENSIQHDQSSINIDSLLTPQTSLSIKYDVQTSVASNLSAGLKTLDLDSFLALSTDDDEVGRDGSLISKEVCQEPISKQAEEQPVDESSSKSGAVRRLMEQFPEGVLYIEESASSASVTEDPGARNMKLEESSQHTHSEGGVVPDSDNRNVIQSSACLKNDVELEAKSVSAISSENCIGLDSQMLQTASTDSTQKLKLLSYENTQETDLQMQDTSKDNNLENLNASELATKSSEVLEQFEVSGCNIEAVDKPEKSSTSTNSDNKKTVSSEDRLDELDSSDISNTQCDTSLQCSDTPSVTSATSLNVPEINKEMKGVTVDSQTALQNSSEAANCQTTDTTEQKAGETDTCDMLVVSNSSQQPSTNAITENGNNYETERTVNQKQTSICSSEHSFPNEIFCDKADNAVEESQLENKLVQSEISDVRLTSDSKETLQSNSDNANTTSSEDGISELVEEKLQNTSSHSEMHCTKAGNSSLLDEVTDLQKQPVVLQTMPSCSGDEIATGLDKTSNNAITEAEHSSFNNGTSVNLETLSHCDKDVESEEHVLKTDAPLEPVMGEPCSKRDDSIKKSRTEQDSASCNVMDNAKLDAPRNTECTTLSSQDDKESFNVSRAFSAHESAELDISKQKVLLPADSHTEKQQNENVIGSPTSSDVDDSKNTSTDDSVLKTLGATDDQPEVSNIAETCESEGEKEHGNAKTETSQQGIPVSSAINSSTNEKLNTSVRNGALSCISSESYSNVAPLSSNLGILTGLNVLASKETKPAAMQASNVSNINFINLLQPTKKINPSGVSNSHLLSYTNTVLLLPAINAQASNVEYLNPVRSDSEQATSADALSSGSQIKNKDEIYRDFNTNSRNNPLSLHQSTKKSIEPLQKCEKICYQMSGFVFAGEESLSSLKDGQTIQTCENTTNVSPGYVLQKRTEKVTEDPSECADVEASSNIGANSSNTLTLHGNGKEAEIAPSTSKQVGRERRRRKQSLEELRLPEEFMKMEVLPLQEESPVKKKRRYRKRSRTLAVDVKKELESSDYSGETVDGAKSSLCVDNSNLSNIKKVTDSGKSFSNEGSSITTLKENSEEPSFISNKTGENLKKMDGQAEITSNNAVKKLTIEEETVITHPLGSRNEDDKAEMKEGVSPKTTKLSDVNAKERGSHPKRRLFKQFSCEEDLLKKDEKKSKKILSKANSLDQELLNTALAISALDHDGPGTFNQPTEKSRASHKKQSAEKIEEDIENKSQKTSDKTVKCSSPQFEQVVQSVADSKNKKDVPETLPQKQLSKSKVKGFKESLRHISRRTSLKHKLIKKYDSPERSSKNIRASEKSSSPVEKKEERTASIIRELRKRMTPHRYRRQEDSPSVSKKQNVKTNAKKLKTNKVNTNLTTTESSQKKEGSEQDKNNLRRSARQYIKKKIVKIRMSLRMKRQGSGCDTASHSTQKSIFPIQEGTDSMSNQKQKTNDRKKCPNKITKSKSDKRKKLSTFGRGGFQTQRSNSPEYPIAIPMPQGKDCAHKENEDTLDDKTVDEEANTVDSKLNPVSTDIRNECLQNECALKPDVVNVENSAEVKISSEEKVSSAGEETNSFRAVTDNKVDISVKPAEITECSEIRRIGNIGAKDSNVISADVEEMTENENSKSGTNMSDKETNGISKLDPIISSDSQVNKVSKEVPTSDSQVDKVSKEVLTSDSQVDETSKEVPTSDSQVDKISKEVPTSDSQVDETSKEVPTSDSQVDKISKEVPTSDSQVDETSKEVPTSDSQVDKISKEVPTSDVQVDELSKEVPISDVQVDELSKEVPTSDIHVDDLSKEVPSSDVQVDELSKEVPTSDVQVDETSKEVPTSDNQVDKVSKEVPTSDIHVDDLSKEVPSSDVQVDELSKEVPTSDVQVDETSKEVPTSDVQVDETSKEVPTSDNQVDKVSKEVPTSEVQVDELSKEVPTSDSQVDETSKEVPTSDSQVDETSKEVPTSDSQVDETSKEVANTNRDLTEAANSAEMDKLVDAEIEGGKPKTNQVPSELPKADKEIKPEAPKKKFFKHREPGQMRSRKFTCIFNIEENDEELPETVIKTEKSETSLLEGPFRETEQYRMYGKRYREMSDYELTESATENVEKRLQLDSHMLDIGINLPEISDITFIAPSERKRSPPAKEMKCYMGKRRRLLDEEEVEEEEEEEEEEEDQKVKEEPQEELEFQSSRWPETTRKRCYPGKRTPKFSQEYQKRSPERSSLRSYGKRKVVDSPEDGTDKFKQGSPKLLSKYAAMNDNRQQKRSIVNSSLDDEGEVSSKQVEKKEVEQRFNLPPHLLGRNIGDPASDPTERKSPLQQPRIGVRVPYRNLTSQIVSSQEIVREILERSRVRSTAIAMAMNKRVADAVDRSFSKRLNASLARLPMPNGPEELEAALQASAGTKLKLLPQDKEHDWPVGLRGVIGSSATPTVTTIKSSSNYTGKSVTRSRSSATRGAQGSGLYLDKEAEREIALRQLETLPSRCRSSRRQTESAVKVTKPKKLDWCKQRSRRKQSK